MLLRNKSLQTINCDKDRLVENLLTKVHTCHGVFKTQKDKQKTENELEFRTGVRRAFEGDLRLPNIEGFSLKEMKASGNLAAMLGGRKFLNNHVN